VNCVNRACKDNEERERERERERETREGNLRRIRYRRNNHRFGNIVIYLFTGLLAVKENQGKVKEFKMVTENREKLVNQKIYT
jgi:hypothetical protein